MQVTYHKTICTTKKATSAFPGKLHGFCIEHFYHQQFYTVEQTSFSSRVTLFTFLPADPALPNPAPAESSREESLRAEPPAMPPAGRQPGGGAHQSGR